MLFPTVRHARLGKLHQFGDELLLFGRWRNIVHDFVFLGSVYADVLCRSVVRYLGVERCQLRNFDEIAETLLLYNLVGNGELVVGALLGEDSRPSIEGLDILLFQRLWAKVLKEQIQLRQTVGDCRSRKEGRP